MSIDSIILSSSVVAIILLGLVVYTRNPKNIVNQRFSLLSLFLVFWATFNYFSDNAQSNNLLYTRLTIFAGIMAASSLIGFITNFPTVRLFSSSKMVAIHHGMALMLVPSSFLPIMIVSVGTKETGTIETSYMYYVFLIYIIYSMFLLFYSISKQFKSVKTNLAKQQIKYVSYGLITYAVLTVFTNVLIPLFFNNWSPSRFGPIFTLLIVGMVAFTIVKHSLFDIRLIIARSLGYIFTISSLIGGYVFVITVVSHRIFSEDIVSGGQTALIIATTLVFGFSLPPLKRFFDRLTNKLFYQDAYDVQAFLDEFNKTLVGNIDIQPLLRQSAELIETTLKAESCVFEIHATESSSRRLIGSKAVVLGEDEVSIIMTESERIHQNLIITDELGEKHNTLKVLLAKNNIAILSQLNSAVKKTKDLGYLVLGQKKSGNPYNKQDLQVLEIISNELVIAVQNALRFEEIQEFTVTLQAKVEDRTKELRRANEKLKALDETKDEFISMASHQLRTPLTAVKGYLSMVVEGDAGKVAKPQKELLDQAFASSQRMVYLIADLLNVSRLKTGKFVIENKPTQLAEVVESEMHQLTEMAASKNQTLTFNKPDKFPAMMLDETKIRQVIMNFADNALHYTPNDGHIQLTLVDKPESIEYIVTDDGLGVPKTEQHHLFTKFYRANNAKKARPDGTGLGLFMAKKVIIAQGGAVIFKSEENKGSTFGFTIPKNAKTVAPKQNASAKK